jgi:ParB-like chromosome segregation protein Spo0J
MKKLVEDLKVWNQNPREITPKRYKSLKKYIKKYGLLSPLKVTPNGEVLGGNHRLKVINELGWKRVWCFEVNPKTEDEKLEIALIDNQEFATYVLDKLEELIIKTQDLELDDFSVAIDHLELQNIAENDIDFTDIDGNQNREKKFKNMTVTCPHCKKTFEIKV